MIFRAPARGQAYGPPANRRADRPANRADDPAEADGGTDPGFDEAALYVVGRGAVEDAILSVIGTVLLVGLGFVTVRDGIASATSTWPPAGGAIGGVVALVGVSVASTLEVIPPVSEWLR